MELIQYIRLVRRWLWLLLLAGFIGGGVSFIVRTSQPLLYQAQTLINIGGFIQSPNPDQQEIRTGFDLTETYAQLVRTEDVLEATINAINAPIAVDDLDDILETRILPNTSLLQLTITYTDPILSADIINELAGQLILASPTNLTPELQSQVDLLNDQITSLTQEITTLRQQVLTLDAQLSANNVSDTRREELQLQRTTLINQINQASSNIAQFTTTIANLQQRTNSVEIVERARIPENPIGQNIVSSTILGAITSIALAFGAILVYEYLNDTFHTAEEVSQTIKSPILGVISRYGKKNEPYQTKLLINNLNTRLPDEYRILRTNLLFSSEKTKGIYVITSASPNEGKSITISNLAISLAVSGVRVMLIDADLRRPRIHEIFGLENSIGLTSLLSSVPTDTSSKADYDEDLHEDTGKIRAQTARIHGIPQEQAQQQLVHSPDTWRQVVQSSGIENLRIIPSGYSVSNPTELLGSALMKRWISIISKNPNFDIILIDTPPVLGFPDGTVITALLEAKAIMVLEAGRTRREAAVRMMERFSQVNGEVVGIVLNQANPRDEGYYGYGYYTRYYNSNNSVSS